MTEAIEKLQWEESALKKYKGMISKIPMFHREIAQTVVDKQAAINARERGANMIEEDDIVRAFLSEVPKSFYSLMIRLFDEVGFDYEGKQ